VGNDNVMQNRPEQQRRCAKDEFQNVLKITFTKMEKKSPLKNYQKLTLHLKMKQLSLNYLLLGEIGFE